MMNKEYFLEKRGVPLKRFCIVDAWVSICRRYSKCILSGELRGPYLYSDCIICEAKHDSDAKTATAFAISPDKNIFYCYACQTGGDCLSLFSQVNKTSTADAYKLMKRKYLPQRTEKGCTSKQCLANPDAQDQRFKKLVRVALKLN